MGLPCLEKERAGDLRAAKCLWLEARLLYTNVPLFVAQRRFFPPVPASPSLDVSVGPEPAQCIHIPIFLCVWRWERLFFKEREVMNQKSLVQDLALPLTSWVGWGAESLSLSLCLLTSKTKIIRAS